MRQIIWILLLLPGSVFAQGNPNYDSDFDDNDCYTVVDVLSLLVILMPDDAGMTSPNSNYDPDYDGDGVIDIGDLTHLLALFGNCEEAPVCSSPDMDGYAYSVVQIGDQCWFAENLRTTLYADGTEIPSGLTDSEWESANFGATSVYGEGSSSCSDYSPDIDACDEALALEEYGRLYNWYAVDDARGLCPSGWHVATEGDWTDLENHVSAQGFSGSEGSALKSTYGWRTDIPGTNTNGTDDFGFLGLPSGMRVDDGEFDLAGSDLNLWSSSPTDTYPWSLILNWGYPIVLKGNLIEPHFGLSVRCLRDADYTEVQGCTDPDYLEYDASANTDDGSCATLASPCDSPSMDGYAYSVVQIGDQCWFAENLHTTTYADGTDIPAGLTDGEWTTTNSGATAVYGEDDGCDNYSPDIDACDEAQSLGEYGRLYNWYAVDDARGLCPSGWHVPTDGEWTNLENHISSQGFDGTEGTALKSTYGWFDSGIGTDDFGFSALPGGYRDYNGYFPNAGYFGYWWSSSPSGGFAWSWGLYNNDPDILRFSNDPRFGFSVRCLRDAD